MTVEVSLQHRFGAFSLDANFAAGMGVTALFGPSGSGKSSVINAVAGLFRPDAGRIAVDGEVLFDSAGGIALAPHRRRVGYVFQDARLLPHLSVEHNLLFGRWFRRREAGAAAVPFDHVVDVLNLSHLLGRHPGALSGGEKQRVGIGRALLACPRLLLMDEPLASLDQARRHEVLEYLDRIRHELRLPVLYVTHALDEVMRLADQVVLFQDGRTVSQGAPADVLNLHREALDGLGDEPGTLLETTVVGHDAGYGLTELRFSGGRLRVPRVAGATGDPCRILVRARDIAVATELPAASSVLNVLPARVEALRLLGDAVEVRACVSARDNDGAVNRADAAGIDHPTTLVARITRYSADQLRLTPGTDVFLLIKSVALTR
ncbi:molybdenum ABC transporter ATP-binding protein [Pandoraea terrae]|uniref:Molybdenum ABC transporter ATP-binding protein n=1 Tax=Pandoraea terrae TaxID=1537710 RepID=A0A5E4UPK3_9BURK|nr:molybdenum ABC transporter ATP-binding protein [Pandoraea terrae]VVE01978.1 molybdenum ABC transporter ATP-binding protein [Pandoraea terrae]